MISERLKELRNNSNLSQKKLADLMFVSQQAVAKWETNKAEPSIDMLKKLSDVFNVPVDYLLGYSDNNTEPYSYSSTGVLKVPVYGYIPAGIPMEAIEDILDYEEVPEEWTLGGKEFFALKLKGDSMEPEYRSGDVVIFLRQDDCENNEDCAVAINGNDWTFKRVEKMESGVLIKPLNPSYDSQFFSNEQCTSLPVQVKGVFWELRRSRRK